MLEIIRKKSVRERREVPFLRLTDVNAPFMAELEEAAVNVVKSGWYLNGEANAALEKSVCKALGCTNAVAVSNGLDALRLMIRAYIEAGRLKPGDEIIVPANTYIATVLPATEFGLRPVYADVRSKDFCLDFAVLDRCLSSRTRAIMLVHLYGNPCWDTKTITRLHNAGILVFEDNAQAIGAMAAEPGLHGKRHTGTLGDCAATSFYPTKNVGALGDAGMVTTFDAEIAATVRALANYGSDRRYHNIYAGYNCRMDEIQAAMLEVKMKHLDEISEARRQTAAIYDRLIDNPAVRKPEIFDDRRQVWHQYTILCTHRDKLRKWLAENGIGSDVSYPEPPYKQPCYAKENREVCCPVAERLCKTLVNLPIAAVRPEDAEYVAAVINDYKD